MLENKSLVILGAGESGVGAALLGKLKGYNVFVSDGGAIADAYKSELTSNAIGFEEGQHKLVYGYSPQYVVKSPGIPDKVEVVQTFVSKGIPVISEIEFACYYTDAKIIGITGSNGKTTTSLLTYHLLKESSVDVGLAGNVGFSLAKQVATDDKSCYVVELSSFQLDGMIEFKPSISVLLNITPDHLDRYEYKFENYIASKFKINENQDNGDAFVYCADDKVIVDNFKCNSTVSQYSFGIKTVQDGSLLEDQLVIKLNDEEYSIEVEDLPLTGKHNYYNVMASVISARLQGASFDQIDAALKTFKNASHRMEEVATIDGVTFINDSKATNISSTWYALDAIDTPVIWIAGGVDKGNDYSELDDLVESKVKGLICLGKNNEKLASAFGDKLEDIVETQDVAEAVKYAKNNASMGDTVLLSPACASFDLFKNYEDRGDQFKAAVQKFINHNN